MRTSIRLLVGLTALCLAVDSTAQVGGLPTPTVELRELASASVVPFERYRRWMVVHARVAGSEPLRFILDSGAPIVVLANAELGARLDLEIGGRVLLAGAGDGEPTPVDLARGVTVELDGVTVHNANMAVGAAAIAIAGLDGILGGSIFRNLVVEIDWEESVLRLHDPSQYRYGGTGTILPLHLLDSGHLLVEATLGVGSGARPVNLLVDTGAGHALSLDVNATSDRAPLNDLVIGWGSNGVARGDIGTVDALTLGTTVLEDVVTSFPAGQPWRRVGAAQGEVIDGNVGQRILERFRVIFNVPRGELILEPGEHSNAPFEFDTTGMALAPWSPGSGAIEIVEVMPGSPAADAGIQAGDQLLTIDGQSVMYISPEEIETLLWGPPGVAIEVAVVRDGRQRSHTLTRRRLLR